MKKPKSNNFFTMENFIPVSRELLFSSLWRSLADKEAKILIDLMARAPYQPTTFNLYGVDIELNQYELCFSCVKMAEKYDISESFFKRYLNKLVEHKIIEKRKRKLVSVSCSEKRPDKRTGKRSDKRTASKLHFVTSIIFCGWVFGENTDKPSNEEIDLSNELSNDLPNGLHNIEDINTDNLKKEKINIYNAREKKFFSNQEGVKHWMSVDRIKRLDFPHADEIMKSWIKYCSKRKELVMEELEKYCDLQICLQQTEMTLPVFDYRFRGVLKRAFDVKECKKDEDKPYLNYLD